MREQENRRGRPPRRLSLSTALIVGGAFILLTPLAFMLYDEALYRWEMSRLPQPSPVLLSPVDEVAIPERLPVTPPPAESPQEAASDGSPPAQQSQPGVLPPPPTDLPVLRFDRSKGMPGYQVEIPRIGAKYLVGEGIDDPVLAKGPGHYPQTALPGEAGTAALAGHRTIRGKPAFFYRINELEPGDEIRVGYQDKTLTFLVEEVYLTSPYDLSVLSHTPYQSLTLTTCDPPGSDEKRLIVRSRLYKMTDNS